MANDIPAPTAADLSRDAAADYKWVPCWAIDQRCRDLAAAHVRLSVHYERAIRAAVARLEKADKSFDPQQHEKAVWVVLANLKAALEGK